jgi:hypothetical protein
VIFSSSPKVAAKLLVELFKFVATLENHHRVYSRLEFSVRVGYLGEEGNIGRQVLLSASLWPLLSTGKFTIIIRINCLIM